MSAFGVDMGGISKAGIPERWKKPTNQNDRRTNVRTGTEIGAAEGAAAGSAIGVHRGIKTGKNGVRQLASVGAHPGRVGAARLTGGIAARRGGKAAVGVGAFGAAVGAYSGAISPARRKQKVSKADRRTDALMGGAAAGAGGGYALTRSGSKDLIRSARPGKTVAVRKLPTPLKVRGARKGAAGLALGAASVGAAVAGEHREKRQRSYMEKSAFGVVKGAVNDSDNTMPAQPRRGPSWNKKLKPSKK